MVNNGSQLYEIFREACVPVCQGNSDSVWVVHLDCCL